MELHESAEDYLEAILILKEKHGTVRSVDVASYLGVTRPSVSVAMKRLRENGYLVMDEDSDRSLTLTDSGLEVAQRIYERHKLLTDIFEKLGVPSDTARDD
ncbi:MAG: metal-dependent transcriptional regulator, partial [Clostridia bacterium]|nr:metal-dependent transcriptional regulator [Clostridia bacterium]